MSRFASVLAPLCILAFFSSCRSVSIPSCFADGEADGIARLRSHIDHEVSRGFSGSVLIAERTHILIDETYGAAEPGHEAFWIASISKPVTAVAALRLVEEGLLDLEAPLTEYLQDVPERWRHVTAHHLLSHRSGIPHAYAADGIADRDDALRTILALKPVAELGEFHYSNDGYTLLAILLEIVAGQPFESIVRRRVFEPARMTESGFWGHEDDPSPVAPPDNPKQANNSARWNGKSLQPDWGMRGASGIYATAGDLYRFVAALERGMILSRKSVEVMLSSKNPAIGLDAQSYGYGWAIRIRDGNVDEYWHAGYEDWLGHSGLLKVKGERVYVILSNSGEPDFNTDGASWSRWLESGLLICSETGAAS